MSFVCDNCGKKSVVGRSQQHQRGVAGKRWKKKAPTTKRIFRPNLQWKSLIVSGEKVRMKLCTGCIKKFKREGKLGYTPVSLQI